MVLDLGPEFVVVVAALYLSGLVGLILLVLGVLKKKKILIIIGVVLIILQLVLFAGRI